MFATFSDYRALLRAPRDFVLFLVVPALWEGSFLLLSIVSAVVARDLWKLRNRGQQLASVSMVSWLFVGGVMVILAYNTLDSFFLPLGVSACILALFFLVYLQLPTVRSKFAK